MFSRCLRALVLTLCLSMNYCERISSLTPVHQSLETFAKNLLKEIVHEENEDGRYNKNLVVSPVGVWSLLALISEGASGETESQLKTVLSLTSDANIARRGYRSILKAMLHANRSSTSLECANAIFADANRPLLPDFEYLAETHYASAVRGVDLQNASTAADAVNGWVSSATHGRITNVISAGDIVDAEIIMANAVFFQGAWALPFNATFTMERPFYADYRSGSDEVLVANVPMMYQSGPFKMAVVDALKAHVLELPYEGGGLSMLVVLPQKGTSLAEVFGRLRSTTLEQLLQMLEAQSGGEAGEEEETSIDVFLPRFAVNTRIQLKDHLKKLGLSDLFDAARCDLRKLARSRLFVSKVLHRAEIKVAEEGTVASAVTVATINNFSMPTVFNANHPFLFIVIERSTKAIIFAGKVSNPSIP
ncbi:serine protease inhibitor-like [Ischnura elegans]|uniref:serine protease inhibitor-like n=1 Tax=Ischnura elegans TaxID=197161 RepID=UPI001ED86FA8|nr:serine protease inhibitor-like [Ischnura elegans]